MEKIIRILLAIVAFGLVSGLLFVSLINGPGNSEFVNSPIDKVMYFLAIFGSGLWLGLAGLHLIKCIDLRRPNLNIFWVWLIILSVLGIVYTYTFGSPL